jgi:hypothetical protein
MKPHFQIFYTQLPSMVTDNDNNKHAKFKDSVTDVFVCPINKKWKLHY